MPRRLQTELMTYGAVQGARALAVVRRWPPVRGESGAVTIEFVVIFPLILLILAFIAFVSFAIAAQSEVQQVAFELTRFGMLLAQDPGFDGDICTALASDYMPRLIENTVTLSAENFSTMGACPGQPDASDVLTVSVTYDMVGSLANAFSGTLGITLGEITRQASVVIR